MDEERYVMEGEVRCYELAAGFQLWTFAPYKEIGPLFNWHPGHEGGEQPITRKVAASFLLTFRRDLEKTLDQ